VPFFLQDGRLNSYMFRLNGIFEVNTNTVGRSHETFLPCWLFCIHITEYKLIYMEDEVNEGVKNCLKIRKDLRY